MKILFIHNNYASNNSGEEYAAESLKEILEANGHQVQWFRRFSDIIENSLVKKIQAFFLAIYNPSAVRELKLLFNLILFKYKTCIRLFPQVLLVP